MPKNGDLRVWWIPQIPMKPFYVPVKSVEEAIKITDVLADYDLFQYENNVKPDYSNAGGLMVWDDTLDPDDKGEKWMDWESEDWESFDEYVDRIRSEELNT